MTEPVIIYRLRTVVGDGASGGGDWQLYEDRDRFYERLTTAMIEAVGRDHKGERSTWLRCRAWLEHVMRKDPSGRGIQRFIGAEKLVGGVWVDLEARLYPPVVRTNETEER